MELESIPGVGEKIAASLAELDDPERAIRSGDIATIARAPGVSEGRAARIARAAIRHEHGESGSFLATDRSRDIYHDLLSLLADRAVTAYAAKRLETFYPSRSAARIEEVRAFVDAALDHEPTPAVLSAMEDLAPLESTSDRRIEDRCLATADAEQYAAAREAVPELSVELVDDARGLVELTRGYPTVIALDERFAGVDIDADADLRVEPDALDDPAALVPERTLDYFAANRRRIHAAIAVHREGELELPADLAPLEDALDQLDGDGEVADDELDRLRTALDELEAALEAAEREANERLRSAIRDRDVTIEGTDLLSLVEQGAGVDSILSRELSDAFDAAISTAREQLGSRLDLEGAEADLGARVFPEDPTFPVERDETASRRLRETLTGAFDRRSTARKRELAETLQEYREASEALVHRALEHDVELAIARFARDFGCSLPEFDGTGISITGGRCPLLGEPFEAIDPVDYAVDDVRVLSGVNSGGKTSTLDLLATVAVLAHMGFPVPAERVRLQRFERLHYYTKARGTLDAGAFESTLRSFDALLEEAAADLVLVDELESITEPGASATIIAGILELLADRGATAVFVSHLASEVRAAVSFDLGVDGIEAAGLVDGQLVVDRSPVREHLARSTPELIVEKLAAEGDSAFYERLVEKFDADG